MSDFISGISGVVAIIVLAICFVNNIRIDQALIRALVTFVACNIMGYLLYGLYQMTLKNVNNSNNDEQFDMPDLIGMEQAELENGEEENQPNEISSPS